MGVFWAAQLANSALERLNAVERENTLAATIYTRVPAQQAVLEIEARQEYRDINDGR
jgi:hypothetical protein